MTEKRGAATDLAIRDDQTAFNDYQVAALRQMGVDQASNADLAVFFHQVKRTGLDPFARQIHMLERRTKNKRTQQWETKYTIQTGIDGYRLIARRAVDEAGESLEYDDVVWCGPDGQWADVWLADDPPAASKVTVYRDGKKFSAVARFSEYVQQKDGERTGMWRTMPAGQIAKCAEALALRKAFPQDLSGIYTDDEMAQADNHPAPPAQVTDGPAEPDVVHLWEERAACASTLDEIRALYVQAKDEGAPSVVASILAGRAHEIQQIDRQNAAGEPEPVREAS
jgi:phage recombination protein Bet